MGAIMHKRYKKYDSIASMKPLKMYSRALLIAVVGYLMLGVTSPAHATVDTLNIVTGCGPVDVHYYTGVLNPPQDTYDVYVKLGTPGQSARVSSYVRFNDGSTTCNEIGGIEASGNEWRKIGSYTDIDGEAETILQLSSSILTKLPSANRPSLMLVSQTTPACVPNTECATKIAGQTAYIRGAGTALEENGLHVTIARPVDMSTLVKVQYFVDNDLLYETKALEEFDTSILPYYAHKLTRMMHFSSGQIAVIQTSAPKDSLSGPLSIIQRFFIRYRAILTVTGYIIGTILIIKILESIIVNLQHRHRWKVNHGFTHTKTHALTPAEKHRLDIYFKIKTIYLHIVRGLMIIVPVLILILITTTFVFQIGTISGRSMLHTLKDGQKVIINKIPVTFAQLNKSIYVPKRGDIVAATANFGTIDTSLASGDNGQLIVKRVIGLPGERVVIHQGIITVYSAAHPTGFSVDSESTWSGKVSADTTTESIDVTLPEDEVFLCGDNRPESIDSRFNGPISTNQIIGTIIQPSSK